MKTYLDYLSPFAVLCAMAALAARPGWVSLGAFAVAAAFFLSERFLAAKALAGEYVDELSRLRADAASLSAAHDAELGKLRAEIKLATDGFKQAISTQTVARKLF